MNPSFQAASNCSGGRPVPPVRRQDATSPEVAAVQATVSATPGRMIQASADASRGSWRNGRHRSSSTAKASCGGLLRIHSVIHAPCSHVVPRFGLTTPRKQSAATAMAYDSAPPSALIIQRP